MTSQTAPFFSGEITLGNILTVLGFLVAAYAAWRDMGWRVKNLEIWKDGHQKVTETAIQALSDTRTATVELKRIAEGQERRLQMLEDRA